ncbi:MAG: Gfo/Idh/MocA family oxidoreductase [Pseudomonadota bacterium]|nr:Gfo/Idh/MocA family oxidoreductase [Pseudomonadota bacterium]
MKKNHWGLIGGGKESQIGQAHRIGATIDGRYEFLAGAVDIDPDAARNFGIELGLEPDRAYGSWQEMLEKESKKQKRLDLVTVATPNVTHFEISKAFLEAGFNVLCEKPMTMTVEQGENLYLAAKNANRICAVNYGYSGFSLVREMKSMVSEGVIGNVRLVKVEFAHGHHADARDESNPRVRWRYDPKQAGDSAVMADCGIHALHLACFVTGQEVTEVSADFVSTVPSRKLEDDAMVNFRMSGGAIGRLWSSAIAIGRQHGLTIQVFGERGGFSWAQENPNQLYHMPLGGRVEIIERGDCTLSELAQKASRVTIGHSEGMPLAFANIYLDIADAIDLRKSGGFNFDKPPYPDVEDGLRSVAAIHAAKRSSLAAGQWRSAVPSIFGKKK